MSDDNERDRVTEVLERLLDPLDPIFPLPGMWHAIACYLFTLLAFCGFVISLTDHWKLHPGIEFPIVAGSSLIPSFFLIMMSRGHAWGAVALRVLIYISFSTVAVDFIFEANVLEVRLIFVMFSALALVISASKKYRGFVNILAARRTNIIRMKKEGSYKAE